MKKLFFLLFLSFTFLTYSQVITGEELQLMIESAQKNVVGAHESIVLRTNQELAKSLWGKNVRLNETKISKFFTYPSGEKVTAGVDIYMTKNKAWSYLYDKKVAADLLIENGVRVTQSYDKTLINARQDLFLAENEKDGNKIILELYCPSQELLELLRIGQPQSIEFLITGLWGNMSTGNKIYGILTKVHADRQVIKCSNGHEYDKDVGYKFCPACGEPLK